MSNTEIHLPVKCENFLKQLAADHKIGLNRVIVELCAWAFSNDESRKQFEAWLNEAFPPKGSAEDEARAAGTREREREEETEEVYEDESHEDRNYNEDRT